MPLRMTSAPLRLAACAALLSSFASSEAAPAPPDAVIRSQFEKLDADHDGKLTPHEARPVAQLVAGADANADGVMTLDEVLNHFRARAGKAPEPEAIVGKLAQILAPQLAGRFSKMDGNGDGKLDPGELGDARWLKGADQDGDGAVTLEEIRGTLATLATPEPPPDAGAPPPFEPGDSVREGPRILPAGLAGIGRMIPDAPAVDLDGHAVSLAALCQKDATVIAFISISCPVSKRYLPALAAMEKEFAAGNTGFVLIAPTSTETPAALRAALASAGIRAACLPDPDGRLARMLDARSTTEIFVADARRTIRYRGAIDDQYGLGYSLEAPRHRYAADAIAAVLAGREPAVAATEAPGCVLDLSDAPAIAATPGLTYHNRISRLIAANCQECHREDGVAPFALENYDQVKAKAGMIRRMVERRLMPPWFAAPPREGGHSPWMNDRSLAGADRADLLAWLEQGKPAGDEKDAPLPRTWPKEWAIGTPDAVFQIPTPLEVKATGVMPYKNVTMDSGLTEDKWVRGLEVQPTAREVVHHVLIFVKPAGSRLTERDELGDFFAAYVPGNNHVVYPDGFAKPLPAGSRLHFQIHYTPNGTATTDQVKLGVLYANGRPEHVVKVHGIADVRLRIPPGADNHPETASTPVPKAVRVLGFMPHMHVRGKSFRYDVILPSGETRTLLEVPRYDFNWQLSYRFAEPPLIPAGSRIRATGWFDNSADNPANPDPAKLVKWGPQTTDEMMLGYIEYFDAEGGGKATAAK